MSTSAGEWYRLERRFVGFVARRQVVHAGEHVLLMLSGGADSMAMLHLMTLADEQLRLGLRSAALHVDYAMRGADSDRDRCLVQEACGRLGVPLHVVRLERGMEGSAFQARARSLRYDHARRLAGTEGYDVLLTAHNRDDQAETVIYRLVKYATPRGLAGMRPREGSLGRPMLDLAAAEIRSYCRARGIAYGEDVTNLQPHYARNLIRLEVLPSLRKINPRVTESLAAAAELAAAEEEVIDAAVARALERTAERRGEGGWVLDIARLLAEPEAMRDFVLHRWLREALGDGRLVERRVVDAVRRLAERRQNTGRLTLGGGVEVARRGALLMLRPVHAAHLCEEVVLTEELLAEATRDRAVILFCDRRVHVRLRKNAEPSGADICLGLDGIPRRVAFRHPRRGDRFAPSGLGAESTVLRYLAAARVPVDERPKATVVDVDGTTAWVGFTDAGGHRRGRVAAGFVVDESIVVTLCIREEDV